MKTDYRRLLIYLVLAIALIGAGYYLFQNGVPFLEKKPSGSNLPDILFLTSPVTEFTGQVDKISGSSIWVSAKYSITPLPTPVNNPTNAPGQLITIPPLPPSKTITFKVNIGSYTQIIRPDSPIAYLFNKNTPTPSPKLTMTEIKSGQFVTVSATGDLRNLSAKEFDAATVKLFPLVNSLSGKIESIKVEEGIIILKAVSPVRVIGNEPTAQPVEAEYAVSVTKDTEISRPAADTAKASSPIRYELSDLKTGILITVYTDIDVIGNQKIKALRIEPPADLSPAKSAEATPTVTPKK